MSSFCNIVILNSFQNFLGSRNKFGMTRCQLHYEPQLLRSVLQDDQIKISLKITDYNENQ